MRAVSITLLLASAALPGFAQKFNPFENLGPDIPTPQGIVERMLEAGKVTHDDVVYDLGSGDGRVVITAAQKFGAHAVGVEFQPDLCRKAEQRIHALGLEDHARIIEDSVFRVDLSPATVVTMFFLTSSNERLKPNLEKYLKPGSRVVSNQFPIKGWKPQAVVHAKTGTMEHTIYVYEMGHTR
jgi:ubiquinone/menaquinone biosynthesis C-methylase UbiE